MHDLIPAPSISCLATSICKHVHICASKGEYTSVYKGVCQCVWMCTSAYKCIQVSAEVSACVHGIVQELVQARCYTCSFNFLSGNFYMQACTHTCMQRVSTRMCTYSARWRTHTTSCTFAILLGSTFVPADLFAFCTCSPCASDSPSLEDFSSELTSSKTFALGLTCSGNFYMQTCTHTCMQRVSTRVCTRVFASVYGCVHQRTSVYK